MNGLSGQRVLVLGLGISGRSAASFCASEGADVVAVDERPGSQLEDLGDLPPRVTLRLGEPFPDAADFDLVVPSPGVPRERYQACARRAWGDVELAFRALAVPVVAVTGTNGKAWWADPSTSPCSRSPPFSSRRPTRSDPGSP
jgi:UDP-N-acetylmuramoylalanine--D-glutamate ligase